MPEYVQIDPESYENTPPPYMDPGNSIAKKKSIIAAKKSIAGPAPKKCSHCGFHPELGGEAHIWPAPRPIDHIRPDHRSFIGYVVLIAVVIFLLFAACKYLP
ncbi:unnamed protein product [Auanema sp. JU1783]|nr:unnamed protein product [Auanema sp. JU1783]